MFPEIGEKHPVLIESMGDHQDYLLINRKAKLHKGDSLQIYLPATGKDFMFVEKKKSGLNTKLVGAAAGAIGTGAAAVGVGSGSIRTTQDAIRVMNTASAIEYGADALDQVQNLPISKQAKAIAGKNIIIINWTADDDGYLLEGSLGKKIYQIDFVGAVLTGEIVWNPSVTTWKEGHQSDPEIMEEVMDKYKGRF